MPAKAGSTGRQGPLGKSVHCYSGSADTEEDDAAQAVVRDGGEPAAAPSEGLQPRRPDKDLDRHGHDLLDGADLRRWAQSP